MLAWILIRWAILAAAFAVTAWILSGLDVSGGFWGYVLVSAIFGIVNLILGTLLRIITFPLYLITFGLFSIIVNAILINVTDRLTDHLTVDEFFWTAIWAAIIMSITTMILNALTGSLRD